MIFSDLKSWDLDSQGNAKLQLASPDGTFREAVFSRHLMLALLVVLNRFLMDSKDQFPEGARELIMSQVPMATAAVHLPSGEYALSISTQAGTTHLFPIAGDAMTILSSALADLQAILSAEQAARHSGTTQ